MFALGQDVFSQSISEKRFLLRTIEKICPCNTEPFLEISKTKMPRMNILTTSVQFLVFNEAHSSPASYESDIHVYCCLQSDMYEQVASHGVVMDGRATLHTRVLELKCLIKMEAEISFCDENDKMAKALGRSSYKKWGRVVSYKNLEKL